MQLPNQNNTITRMFFSPYDGSKYLPWLELSNNMRKSVCKAMQTYGKYLLTLDLCTSPAAMERLCVPKTEVV